MAVKEINWRRPPIYLYAFSERSLLGRGYGWVVALALKENSQDHKAHSKGSG